MVTSKEGSRNEYMPQLDGLRAIAVVAVVYSHWGAYGLFLWGECGVQLFFVLSGFLITGILFRSRQESNRLKALRKFYARRALRILPLYYIVLMAAYAANVGIMRESMWWHIAYLSNVYFAHINAWGGELSHFWSLAVEEQFYLFWPVVIIFAADKLVLKAILLLTAVGLLARILLPLCLNREMLLVLPLFNFGSLGMGGILACIHGRRISQSFLIAFTIGAFVFTLNILFLAFDVSAETNEVVLHLSMPFAFAWLIHKASSGASGLLGRFIGSSQLRYLGRISYGLYIVHNFAPWVVRIVAKSADMNFLNKGSCRIALMAIFTVITAGVSWRFLERPIAKLKKYFPYERA